MKVNKDLNPSLRSAEAERFEKELYKRIIGQDEAIKEVTNIYQRFLAGLNKPERPICNVMFLGPTGTGKTRIVESVSEILFGTNKAVIKIDCGEFQHSHEVAKLIGSPPGYLGHRETHAMLTQETLQQHWGEGKPKVSILLFDEIEKASDALWKIMLGITDKATLTLGDNRKVDFSKTMIFMTSNVGAAEMAELTGESFGFSPKEENVDHKKIERISISSARSKFPTEFINRVDKFVTFHTLTKQNITDILELELGRFQQRVLATPVPFVFAVTDEAKAEIIREGFDAKYNARNLNRTIEERIVNPIAAMISSKQIVESNFIRIRFEDGEFRFNKAAEKVSIPLADAVPKEKAVAAAVNSPIPIDENDRFRKMLEEYRLKKNLVEMEKNYVEKRMPRKKLPKQLEFFKSDSREKPKFPPVA